MENYFIDSISPASLDQILKDKDYVKFLKNALPKEADIILNSLKTKYDLKRNFQNNILKSLSEEQKNKLQEKIKKFSRLYLNKCSHIPPKTLRILEDIIIFPKRETSKYKGKFLEEYWKEENYSILTRKERDELKQRIIQDFIIANELVSSIRLIANELFFCTENICKIFCAFSCYDFSLKLLKETVIQHDSVWKTLKKLASDKSSCDICRNKTKCHFKFKFKNLANLYAYSIKIRMLTDYTEDIFYNKELNLFILKEYSTSLLELFTNLEKTFIFVFDDFIIFPLTTEDVLKTSKKIYL